MKINVSSDSHLEHIVESCKLPAPVFLLYRLTVKFRIKRIKVSGVQVILYDSQCFTESLEMYNFALAKKLDRFNNIRIVYHAQDIVVSRTRFLFEYTL